MACHLQINVLTGICGLFRSNSPSPSDMEWSSGISQEHPSANTLAFNKLLLQKVLILSLMIRPSYENLGMLLAVAAFGTHPLLCDLASGTQVTQKSSVYLLQDAESL